jgi:hypothetical protein
MASAAHLSTASTMPAFMIPVPVPGLFFLFLLLVLPVLCVVGTFGLIFLIARKRRSEAGRASLRRCRGKLIASVLFVVLLDGVQALVVFEGVKDWLDIRQRAVNREKREHFMLTEPVMYGDLLLPRGSWVTRRDPFDEGEPDRPRNLTGLISARFPEPVRIAGVWAIALHDAYGELELSHDQIIRGQACKKGEIAKFAVPSIEYDVVAAFGKEEPDGPAARFKPGQWMFRSCGPT